MNSTPVVDVAVDLAALPVWLAMEPDAPRLARIERMVSYPYTKLSAEWARFMRRVIPVGWRAELLRWVGAMVMNRGFTTGTAYTYLRGVGDFLETLHADGGTIPGVTLSTVDRYLQMCFIERRHSAETRGQRANAIKAFYRWREEQELGANPVRDLRGPKRSKRVARKFSTKQLRALFATCDRMTIKGRRDLALLLFFYSTGARRMEIEVLRMCDLELRERTGQVRFNGKGSKERLVTFEGPVIDALRAWFSDRDALEQAGELEDRDAVFVSVRQHRGRILSRNGIWEIMALAVRRARIRDAAGDMGMHRLRSTFASDLYDEGVDVREIQRTLGHNSIETTLRYIAISRRHAKVRLPASRINEAMGIERNAKPLWFRKKEQQRGLFSTNDEF